MSARRPLGITSPSAGLELSSTGFELAAGVLDAHSDRVSSRRGLAAVGGLLASGAIIAFAAAGTGTLLPESIRPVLPSLAGAFAGTGVDLHSTGVIAVLALMFIAYVAVVRLSAQLSARAVLMTIAALYALVLLAPPLISTDIFSYQAYARMGSEYATNPYIHGPHAIALDPIFPFIGAMWSYIPSAYGPVFTIFSYALAPLSIAASVLAYKSLATLACMIVVAVTWQCARLRGTDPVRAAAFVGLNPLLVVYGIGGGHNDLLMLAAVVGAVYAVLGSRERVGGGLAMLAIALKLTGGLILPFALAAGGARRRRGERRDLALGFGAAFLLIGGVTYAFFGFTEINVIPTVLKSQGEGGWKSIPGFIATRLHMPGVGHVASYVLAGAFVVVCAWLLRRVWQSRLDWIAGAGWATLALLVASSSVMAWYVAWLLPLAALGRDRRLAHAALVLSGVVLGVQLLGYIPHNGLL
ncbi:MAG: glycosyltransferase 87 family protein [Solirubrobacteraceae bacterium]|jgi:alpha-1,6-mannosyltransferase